MAALVAVPKLTGGSGSASGKLASVNVAPEPWQGHAKPEYRSETELQKAAPWDTPSKRTAPGAIDPKTGMPAASAGTNGSYTPPSPAERKRVYTATHPVGGVVLEAPFTSAADVGALVYWFLPVRRLMKDQFRSDMRIGSVTAPSK